MNYIISGSFISRRRGVEDETRYLRAYTAQYQKNANDMVRQVLEVANNTNVSLEISLMAATTTVLCVKYISRDELVRQMFSPRTYYHCCCPF